MAKQNSMLTGKPIKSIIKFSLPIMASSLLQYNYTLVDNILVGRYVSTDASCRSRRSRLDKLVYCRCGTRPYKRIYNTGGACLRRKGPRQGQQIFRKQHYGVVLARPVTCCCRAHYFHSSFEAYRHAGRNSRSFLGVCKHSLLCNTVSDALKQFYRNFKSRR